MKPLALDLCCGLGGWTKGLQATGWQVIGIDLIDFSHSYPGHFIQGDILQLDFSSWNPLLIVASTPCEEFTRHDLPWCRKRNPPWPTHAIDLFRHCAAIKKITKAQYMIQENVRGAQPFIGTANAHYGAQYLWGDVPAILPYPGTREGKQRHPGRTPQDRARRAMIPLNLALHIGRTFYPR